MLARDSFGEIDMTSSTKLHKRFSHEICRACKCVFKPKRLTVKNVEHREGCLCLCHWGVSNSDGITIDEARALIS